MSLPRFNYHRITQQVGQVIHNLPLPTQKLKSVFLLLLLVILSLQLFLLVSPKHASYDSYTGSKSVGSGKVIVVDKDAPVSTHYKHVLKKHSENFASLPLDKRCQVYFNELYKRNHDWEVFDTTVDPNKDYQKAAFDQKGYIRERVNKYKDENEGKEPSEGKLAEFELDYQKMAEKTQGTEQSMIDAVTHLRVFGQCFLTDRKSTLSSSAEKYMGGWFGSTDNELESLTHDNGMDLCHDIEERVFPWLSKELPLFVRWDGEKVYGIPKMSRYISDDGFDDEDFIPQHLKEKPIDDEFSLDELYDTDTVVDEINTRLLFKKSSGSEKCFLNSWRKALNGKGLVLSVADRYEHDITGLLRVLRALNNKLPIQLVHKGDLSEEVQKRIVKAARDEEVKVPLHLYEKIQNHVPHNFPKQEVWFVNAKRCIRKDYSGNFNGFANKLIAYLFNSFDDTILMDTDSVPLVKPTTLFKSGPYKRTQTIFFKDRFNNEKAAEHDSQYFKRLMPSTVDESLFGIPPVGNLTLHNRYIQRQYKHVMEAGMVAIKRSTHFTGMLISLQLNFWHSAASRIWGDKELFWLGQSISGNENYEFNKYDTVAAGELTPMELRPRNTIAHELCSTHPGHLSGDDDITLLWVNSGMRTCKVDNTWESDWDQDKLKKMFKNVGELEKYLKGPFHISAVLIPPGGDRRKENKLFEPAVPWQMTPPCKGYMWCAYDILGASVEPEDRGSYIEYDEQTILINDYISRLWTNTDLVDLSKYEEAKENEE